MLSHEPVLWGELKVYFYTTCFARSALGGGGGGRLQGAPQGSSAVVLFIAFLCIVASGFDY